MHDFFKRHFHLHREWYDAFKNDEPYLEVWAIY